MKETLFLAALTAVFFFSGVLFGMNHVIMNAEISVTRGLAFLTIDGETHVYDIEEMGYEQWKEIESSWN